MRLGEKTNVIFGKLHLPTVFSRPAQNERIGNNREGFKDDGSVERRVLGKVYGKRRSHGLDGD